MGTYKPSVVETNVSQSAGSKASLEELGLMTPIHERVFQKSSRTWRCRPPLRGCSSPRAGWSPGAWSCVSASGR